MSRDLREIKRRFHFLLHHVRRVSKKVVVLTIPPIPKYGKWGIEGVRKYNKYIIKKCARLGVQCVDISEEFFHKGNVRLELFERYTGKGSKIRPDLLHWNRLGMNIAARRLRKEI